MIRIPKIGNSERGSLPFAILVSALVLVISALVGTAVAWQAKSVFSDQSTQEANWAVNNAINLGMEQLALINPRTNPNLTGVPSTTSTTEVPSGLEWTSTGNGSAFRWWVQKKVPSATGGDITYTAVGSTSYIVHTFSTVGTTPFTVNTGPLSVNYLIVGGGGGGSQDTSGGGGAGGMREGSASIASGAYNIVVGAGGAQTWGAGFGSNGGNSSFNGVTATGGGGGAGANGSAGNAGNGGSGGGGGGGKTAGTGMAGQGNDGATSANAAGGGGAGGPGLTNGNGGPGKASTITGTAVFYAGGGAGGIQNGTATGGVGGGGSTSATYQAPVLNGTDGLGGGGAGFYGSWGGGGRGGNGVVIIRYPAPTTTEVILQAQGKAGTTVAAQAMNSVALKYDYSRSAWAVTGITDVTDGSFTDPASSAITSGLQLYLDAGSKQSYPGSGNKWYDLSPNANDVTLTGQTYSSANGGSIVFNGNGANTANNVTYGNNTTWEFWAKCNTSLNTYDMLGGRYLPYFSFYGCNRATFSDRLSGTQRTINSPSSALTTGKWYHFVFTTSYDGTNTVMKTYINGVESATGSFAGSQDPQSSKFVVGGWRDNVGSDYAFNGNIAVVKVYGKTLAAKDIQTNFDAGKTRFGYGPTVQLDATSSKSYPGSGTTLLSQQTNMSVSPWTKINPSGTVTVAAGQANAPDGTSTANLLTDGTWVSGDSVYQDVTGVDGAGTYTISVYVKAGTATAVNFNGFFTGNATEGFGSTITTATGVVTGAGAVSVPVGNGWYRVSKTFTGTNALNTTLRFQVYANNAGTTYLWGPQMLKGYGPAPYTGSTLLNSPVNKTEWFDISGNNYNGAIYNAPSASASGINFNGSSTQVLLPDVPDSFWNNGSWTASTWVRFNSVNKGSDNSILTHGANSNNNGLHLLERNGRTYFGFYANDIGGSATLSANTWYNLVFSYDNSTKLKTIYVNGTLDGSGGTVGYSGTGSNTRLGSPISQGGTSGYFNGKMGKVTLYNYALPATQIASDYATDKGKYSSVDGPVMNLDAGDPASYPGTGSTWTDLSGNGHNGIIPGSGVNYVGANGGSMAFNGTNMVTAGAGSALFPLNQVTMESWVKSPGIGTGQTYGGIMSVTYGLTQIIASDGSLSSRVDDGTTNVELTTTGVNLYDNKWHHLVTTNDGTTTKQYIDGVLKASGAAAWKGYTRWPNDYVSVGRDNNNNVYYLQGNIGSAKIYDRALTADEIKKNYDTGKSKYTNGPVLNLDAGVSTSYPANVNTVDYLVVAGGGGGGTRLAGGGGGGGVLAGSSVLSNGTYPVTVGAGGAGAPSSPNGMGVSGVNGSNSVFNGVTALGGGGGGGGDIPTGTGLTGGSGGGGRGNLALSNGGAGTAGQGYAGGSGAGPTPSYGGGGGGGAGGPGSNGTGTAGGNGGIGYQSAINGTPIYYAGGGGGGMYLGALPAGQGGLGGGGNGSNINTIAGSDGVANTGGGGGSGGAESALNAAGGAGGSGIVIVRLPVKTGAPTLTGGTVSSVTIGGQQYEIHTFASSGTLTVANASAASSTTWYNLAGKNNNATLVNGAAYSPAYTGSIAFDGVNDYVQMPSWQQLGLYNKFTISYWVSVASVNSTWWNSSMTDESYLTNGFRNGFSGDGTGATSFWATQSGGTLSVQTPSYSFSYNNPFLYTFTYDGTTGTAYINGVQKGTGTGTFIPPQAGLMSFGAGAGTGYNPVMNAHSITVWDRTLTAAEVKANYTETNSQNTSGAIVSLDAADTASYPGTGTTWFDVSGNDNNAVLMNGTAYLNATNGKQMVFDGVNDYVTIPNVKISSGSFALETWVKPSLAEATGYGTIAGYGGSRRLLVQANGKLLAQIGGANYFSTSSLPANTWSHVTYVYDDTANKEYFYINGALDSSNTPAATPTWNSDFLLGQYTAGSGFYMLNGSIGKFQTYNRAPSAAEIQSSYNSSKANYSNAPILSLSASNSASYPSTITADYLVVGGGGGSGGGGNTGYAGGAGGGGGLLQGTTAISAGTYNVVVGSGGTAGTQVGDAGGHGGDGTPSSFKGLNAIGGGGGGGGNGGGNGGNVGGSGGGGATYSGVGGLGTTGQGYNGGASSGNCCAGGGGGGAGGAGTAAVINTAGNGGAGVSSSITGTATYYAGGGAGSGTGANGTAANGATPAATIGAANTGKGAGGTRATAGLAGGSGIVILRFPVVAGGPSITGGTTTTTTINGTQYELHTFTTTGANTLTVGTTWYNLSSAASNGILQNGVAYSSDNNGALVFNGLNSYVQVPNSSSFNGSWTPDGTIGNQNMTISMWVKTTDTGGYIYSKPWNGSGQYNIQLTNTSMNLVSNSGSSSLTYSTGTVATGNWVNLICWMNSTQQGCYINGNSVGSKNHGLTGGAGTSGNENLPTSIMTVYPYGSGWAGNTGHAMQGAVGDVKVYNRVLSPTEAQNIYDTERTRYTSVAPSMYLDTANPASYPGSGTTWYDLSGKGNNATLVGMGAYSTANGGVLQYDGTNSYASTTFVPNKNEGTICAWYKMNALKDYNTIFDNNLGGDDWESWTYATGGSKFRTSNSDADIAVTGTNPYLVANQYNFICDSWNLSSGKMYMNGVLQSTDSVMGTRNTPQALNIGGKLNTRMNGVIPFFIAYDTEISATDIQNIYNTTRPRYELNLITSPITYNPNQTVTIAQDGTWTKVSTDQTSSTPGMYPINDWINVLPNTAYRFEYEGYKNNSQNVYTYVFGYTTGTIIYGSPAVTTTPGTLVGTFNSGTNTQIKLGVLWSPPAAGSSFWIRNPKLYQTIN